MLATSPFFSACRLFAWSSGPGLLVFSGPSRSDSGSPCWLSRLASDQRYSGVDISSERCHPLCHPGLEAVGSSPNGELQAAAPRLHYIHNNITNTTPETFEDSPVASTIPSRITTTSSSSRVRWAWETSQKGLLWLISWQMMSGDTRKSLSSPVL
ncbi:hypothetical protein EYF80_027830 [Liparis tanakae]|uniref:Uncharacterized protein n=1 Tax=Liparis tanakae TaxID=230148 RepID=A0A4Z2H9R2_9TELE|nr:hypothetical protein EYF80_027830 [Liparis tanakae]